MDKNEVINKLNSIFTSNLGNTLTAELATGILTVLNVEWEKYIDEQARSRPVEK
jgi:hypothetical protein